MTIFKTRLRTCYRNSAIFCKCLNHGQSMDDGRPIRLLSIMLTGAGWPHTSRQSGSSITEHASRLGILPWSSAANILTTVGADDGSMDDKDAWSMHSTLLEGSCGQLTLYLIHRSWLVFVLTLYLPLSSFSTNLSIWSSILWIASPVEGSKSTCHA